LTYLFADYLLDSERRELRRGSDIVPVEPQVFDLLHYLIRHRSRVVTKDELIAEVWKRRIVSDSTLGSRINAVRHAIGDSGETQRLVRTIARRGFRFVGVVREKDLPDDPCAATDSVSEEPSEARASPSIGGAAERRQLTIMDCTVGETATLAARVDPEDLREIVGKFHRCIRQVAARYGGHVAKYTVDGVVVCFGYPRAHEDDAERGVRAGLDAIHAVSQLESECLSEPLQARVGIATGLVLIDNSISGDASAEIAVIGETPYVATELRGHGDPGTVVISASTRRLVGNLFDFEELAPARSNGSAEFAAAWRVLRESGIASRFEALRSSRKQLIGRDEELKLLLHRWRQVKPGEGRTILVWGEPGIGKSHLVAAFQDTISAEPHTCMRYFCAPNRIQTALHPVVAQLEHAAGFDSADSDAVKLHKLERLLALSSQQRDRDVALIAELLSISSGAPHATLSLSAQRRKELLLESFVSQLVGLARREPVLMVLEDAHWIDPTTRELFDIVVDRVRELPVLLILTYRPEFTPPWVGQSHVTVLTLNHLNRRDNAALIKQVAGGKDLPPSLLEQLVTRSDGIPLFIEEVTKSVLESGMLREEDDVYVLDGPLPIVTVPSSLQASLVARLDRIAAARAVVQTSAALGREFRFDVLRAVTLLPDAALEALLDQVVASELVHQRGVAPHAVYAFKHALVQDAAYETMPKDQRSAVHRRIADVLEQQFPDIAEHHPDVLAYHCTEAGLPDRGVDYWIRAARVSLNRSAGIEAQGQVEKAMDLLPKVADSNRRQVEGRLQVVLGDALVMTKGFASPEVKAALSRARELIDEQAHPLEALGALCGLFNYHLIRSESPRCLELATSWLRDELDTPSATVIHYLVGTAHLHLGNFKASIHHLESALLLYEEDACRAVSFIAGYHLRSFTLIWLGLAYLYVGSLQRATEVITSAVTDARSRSHPFTLVSALLALARFKTHTGDLERAIAATEEGMAIATEQRSPYHVSRAGVLRAANVVASGRPEEGIALMNEALAAHRATGADFLSSYNFSCLAEAHAHVGDGLRANELALQAVAEVVHSGERWWEAEAQRIRGEILLSTDPANRDEAEACFTRALECARRQEAKLWELHAALSLARLWSSQDQRARAHTLLTDVYASFGHSDQMVALTAAGHLLRELGAAASGTPRGNLSIGARAPRRRRGA